MSGHSHANNIKHKKNRNDKLKSETFLKLRKKIEFIYRHDQNSDKIFALARESNFPKEKVNAIIDKISSEKNKNELFFHYLFKSKFDIIWDVQGFLKEEEDSKISKIFGDFSLEKITNKSYFDYFDHLYLLMVKSSNDFENFIISSFSSSIIDKINRIDRLADNDLNFALIFSDKKFRNQFLEELELYPEIEKIEVDDFLSPFSSIELNSEKSISFFLLLKKEILKVKNNLKIFTNVSLKGEKGP